MRRLDNEGTKVSITSSIDGKNLDVYFSIKNQNTEECVELLVFSFEVENLLEKGISTAAHTIGNLVLYLFGSYIEDNPNSEKNFFEDKFNELERLMQSMAAEGNPDALSYLAARFLTKSVERCDESLLELADIWFFKAAETGHHESRNFYELTWPRVRKVHYEEIIKRKNNKAE